ncbi:hypothetical protein HDV02_006050 [Globomyces sp. JEL0801]|nr:hypothetical protein HDV02_006050 [Globomyces sp. JEL0801]
MMLDEEQDTVILKMMGIDENNDTPVCYYVVSLAILRLFPLSYLNDIFPFGIVAGTFLTGHEIKDIMASVLPTSSSSNEVFMSPTPLSGIRNRLSMHSMAESDTGMDIDGPDDSHMDDIDDHSDFDSLDFNTTFKVLFERFETFDQNILDGIVNKKSLLMRNELDLFQYLGKYFQSYVFHDIAKTENIPLPPIGLQAGIPGRFDFDCREFMFLKEQMDMFLVPQEPKPHTGSLAINLNPLDAAKKTIAEACQESLHIAATTVQWGIVETNAKAVAILESLERNGFISKDYQWDHRQVLQNKKTVNSFCIIPISSIANPRMPSSDTLTETPEGDVNPLITQVTNNGKTGKSIESCINEREPFKQCWWQQVPIIQTQITVDEGGLLRRSRTNEFVMTIGTLWIRRTWTVEFSILN